MTDKLLDFKTEAGFLDGFSQSAAEAWQNPVDTASKVGSGLAIGAAIQAGLNNAEHLGGKIGLVAKTAKVSLIVGSGIFAANEIATSDKPSETAGRMAFDLGLFLGAARLAGGYADRVPGVRSLTSPRATSEVPKGLEFEVRGNQVRVDPTAMEKSSYGTVYQIRLANGRGFRFTDAGIQDVPLRTMPVSLPGKGRIEYAPEVTTLRTDAGQSYNKLIGHGSVSTKIEDGTLSTSGGGKFHLDRRSIGTDESVTWNPDGSVSASQPGRLWKFNADGSAEMRSLPYGKHRLAFSPDGNGISRETYGRIAGPISNHTPFRRTETLVSLKDSNAPAIVPPTVEQRNALLNAKLILDQI